MGRIRKTILTLLVVGVVGTLAGFGTFSAFTSTTDNTGNNFTAGTVVLSDNDAGTALYNVSNQKPAGTTTTNCIKVSYTGSLDSDVKLYNASAVNSFGQYVNLTVTQGTGNNFNCSDFVADGGAPLYNGDTKAFSTAYPSYASGLSTYPSATPTKWTGGASPTVTYRFQVQLQSGTPDSAQGGTTGSHTYTWEARNQ